METVYDRTELLIGKAGIDSLRKGAVIVFGLGGVGGMAVEALARAGVGYITLVDFDEINITNINRQIIALHSNIGEKKAEVMKKRIADINPDTEVHAVCQRLTNENIDSFLLEKFDYIIDAIDDVSAKLSLIEKAFEINVPIVSSMGTGDKVNPEKLSLKTIMTTNTCPLARVVRGRLKKSGVPGVENLIVVCSTEKPERAVPRSENNTTSSISYVPPAAGLLLAKEVILTLIKKEN